MAVTHDYIATVSARVVATGKRETHIFHGNSAQTTPLLALADVKAKLDTAKSTLYAYDTSKIELTENLGT